MQKPLARFLIRWLVSSLGLWIAAAIVQGSISYQHSASVIIIGGLVLAIINTIIKPLVVLLSLPAILFTLGLFMLIVNGFSVYLASLIYPALEVGSFWAAILAGLIIGLVNYLVTAILDMRKGDNNEYI
jgi:putative membrane protein